MVEDDPEQDVSGGLEPNVIPLLNATETDVTKLKEEFTASRLTTYSPERSLTTLQYISDSIFPDNTPICDVILKQPDKTPLSAVDSDEDDSDDIEDWTCDCQAIPGACSVDQGYKCDCVGSFGMQTLLIDGPFWLISIHHVTSTNSQSGCVAEKSAPRRMLDQVSLPSRLRESSNSARGQVRLHQ